MRRSGEIVFWGKFCLSCLSFLCFFDLGSCLARDEMGCLFFNTLFQRTFQMPNTSHYLSFPRRSVFRRPSPNQRCKGLLAPLATHQRPGLHHEIDLEWKRPPGRPLGRLVLPLASWGGCFFFGFANLLGDLFVYIISLKPCRNAFLKDFFTFRASPGFCSCFRTYQWIFQGFFNL